MWGSQLREKKDRMLGSEPREKKDRMLGSEKRQAVRPRENKTPDCDKKDPWE